MTNGIFFLLKYLHVDIFRNNTDLELVFLGNNQIESIEDQFADLEPNTKFSLLDLSNNKLSALPKSFKNLIGMKNLYLQWNHISGLDGILKSMHQLTQLDLTGNHFRAVSYTHLTLPTIYSV